MPDPGHGAASSGVRERLLAGKLPGGAPPMIELEIDIPTTDVR
jgi:hypothetical protein